MKNAVAAVAAGARRMDKMDHSFIPGKRQALRRTTGLFLYERPLLWKSNSREERGHERCPGGRCGGGGGGAGGATPPPQPPPLIECKLEKTIN